MFKIGSNIRKEKQEIRNGFSREARGETQDVFSEQ